MGNQRSKGKEPIVDENGDFIWRFRLEHGLTKPTITNDAFAELFRSQLDEMLKLSVFTYHGKRVRVDGFCFINDPDCQYPLWPTPEDQEMDDSGIPGPAK